MLGCSFSRLSRPRQSLVRTYIEDIKTDTILHAIQRPPSNLHFYPVVAYSEINSPSRPAGQHLVISELVVVGGVLGSLVVHSVAYVAQDDRLFVPILKT